MKKFLLSFAVLIGFSSMGLAQTIAQLPLSIGLGNYAMVELDDNGSLIVTNNRIHQHNVIGAPITQSDRVEIDLPKTLFESLLRQAAQLSDTQLDVHHQDVVCLMIAPAGPSPDLKVRTQYSYDDGFEGEMRVVLTQRGCWAHTHISPRESHNVATAHQLIGSLKALGFQALQ